MWIVSSSERTGYGQAGVYRVHPDGTGLERLTDDPALDDQGVLSPDDDRLAFVSTRATHHAGHPDTRFAEQAASQSHLPVTHSRRPDKTGWILSAFMVAGRTVDSVHVRAQYGVEGMGTARAGSMCRNSASMSCILMAAGFVDSRSPESLPDHRKDRRIHGGLCSPRCRSKAHGIPGWSGSPPKLRCRSYRSIL